MIYSCGKKKKKVIISGENKKRMLLFCFPFPSSHPDLLSSVLAGLLTLGPDISLHRCTDLGNVQGDAFFFF